MRIVHLLDASTPADSVGVVARLLELPGEHRAVVLGHRSTERLLAAAGIDPGRVSWVHSMGALDFVGARGVRRVVEKLRPTHLHAWGTAAAIAAALVDFRGMRVATFTDVPRQARLLKMMAGMRGKFRWVASSTFLQGEMELLGISPVEVIPLAAMGRPGLDAAEVRSRLGIGAGDFPVLLHGGEGPNARQDFGIWTSAVLAQLYPRARMILRQDARTGQVPGLERFGRDLPDERLVIAAPWQMAWSELLGVADVFLVTATGSIPVGSIVEAMSAGVPVVGTPVGCVKELVRHGQTGLISKHIGVGIAPPVGRKTIRPRAIAAALERLLSGEGLGARLGAAAREEAQGWTVEAMVRAYERVYEDNGRITQNHTAFAQSHTEPV